MEIISRCPVCLSDASMQTLVENNRTELTIYHCVKHGSFAVAPELDTKLQSMRITSGYKIELSVEVARLDSRLRETIRPVDGPQTKIPIFRSV
ncbi:hypothetical protein ACQYRI_08695 [Salmonella enterica]